MRDDYGMPWDEITHRNMAIANAEYIATGGTDLLYNRDYRYYGVAFDMSLLLSERALGLQDSRDIYLTRRLAMHLFFIAGGFACAALAYRMIGSRWVALMAMLMFLLHPRLYAHSFFNVKDVPFAAMLLIALYFTHRAFRKDTLGAFLLCGIVVGLAINMRPFALMLFPMILAMRGLDLWQAGRAERKRVLASIGIFAAVALAITYILHPYHWENPLRLIESIRVLSQHPTIIPNLFMGEIYWSDTVPWNYIPVWFAITAPPATLALGAIGCAAVCWRAITRPLAALRDRETLFRIMLIGCVAMPVATAIILQSNIYNDWRQMYFLWGPFCLLAAVGLHHIANIHMRSGIWKIGARLPGWFRGAGRLHPAPRALAYGVAGIGLTTTLTAMAALHPFEYVYFNALTDTKTPGALSKRYEMDYWEITQRQSLEYLLDRYPDDTLLVWPVSRSLRILPQNDRERIPLPMGMHAADYFIYPTFVRRNLPEEPAFHSIRAYGSGIAFILDTGSEAYLDYFLAEYADIETNGTLLARSDFDIYIHDGALHYLKENCEPLLANLNNAGNRVFLHIYPADLADLPAERREIRFENHNFWLSDSLVSFAGKCIYRQPLPDYPIARISTGQHIKGELAWRADIDLAIHAAAAALYESVVAGAYGQPVARSDFDVYLRGDALAYAKENCAAGDADARFFLHIIPADPADLPAVRREYGFENLDFQFGYHGAYAGDNCVAERELPGYAIERIHTGQYTGGEGVAWRADLNLAARAAAQAAHDGIAAGDYGKPIAQSDFDVYLRDNALTYFKESCNEDDTDARFFLHVVPVDPSDLSGDWRERGFDNLDFQFTDHGAYIGDKCVATRELPDYPITRIRTGRNATTSGGDEWRADIDLAAQAVYAGIADGDYGHPAAQSDFDVYMRGNALAYLKENCAEGDADARFFLHIIPADPADLPEGWRERGFENKDFWFADHGAYTGDICVATIDLPDYAIDRIRTGQFISGEGNLWRVEFPAAQ